MPNLPTCIDLSLRRRHASQMTTSDQELDPPAVASPDGLGGAGKVQQLMHRGEQAAWSSAALVLALEGSAPPGVQTAAEAVVRAWGIDLPADSAGLQPRLAAAQASAPLYQVAEVLRGGGHWQELSDEALIAQGAASAQAAAMFVQFALPQLAGLAAALERPGARMLDVGTGTGALAIAYAGALPNLTVVGLDVLPRALALAEQVVAQSPVADRVELRLQDVADLDEIDSYDLAWVPAPFVPSTALEAGMPAIGRAVRPSGWVMIGHGKFAGDPLDDALTRFKTVIYGGTPLDDGQAHALLTSAGFADVFTMPTPPGAPAITVGRKPAG
jgi:SAM-dependent methyltransferase